MRFDENNNKNSLDYVTELYYNDNHIFTIENILTNHKSNNYYKTTIPKFRLYNLNYESYTYPKSSAFRNSDSW
jgi:hypothetical protein